ncbi:MAG: HAMP domain-containing histidine kinase [bacterium]|nr:HAMP domain-containing histidine kinase [bacterium]
MNAKQVDFLADVLEPCLDLVQAAVQEKEVTVDQDLPEGPMPVDCDPALLQVVLVNLLGNAVKYGNVSGKVKVSVNTDESGLRVSVWNEGPGFPESQRSKLFRRFSRIQSPELMQRKGTGVGLYTTWRIVQLHGGKIGAKSEQGSWAEFFFEIPQPLKKDAEDDQGS